MGKVLKSRLLAIDGSKVMVLKKLGKSLRYTLPGGVKKKKETEKEALIRETSEEIALELANDKVHFYFSKVKVTRNGAVQKNYYHTSLKQRKIRILENHKFEKLAWVNWKEVIGYMDKSDRSAVETYFRIYKGKNKKTNKNECTISSRIAM